MKIEADDGATDRDERERVGRRDEAEGAPFDVRRLDRFSTQISFVARRAPRDSEKQECGAVTTVVQVATVEPENTPDDAKRHD